MRVLKLCLSVDAHRYRATRPKASTHTSRQTHVHALTHRAARHAVDRLRFIDARRSIPASIRKTCSPASRDYRNLRSLTNFVSLFFFVFVCGVFSVNFNIASYCCVTNASYFPLSIVDYFFVCAFLLFYFCYHYFV